MLVSERKNKIDFIYEDADRFKLVNWIIIISFHLCIVAIGLFIMEYSIKIPRYSPLIVPPILVILGYLLFKKIYKLRKQKLVEKYSIDELKIFFKRCKSFRHYSNNYLVIAFGVISLSFHFYLKYAENDIYQNGLLIKYGIITNFENNHRAPRGKTHSVQFKYSYKGQVRQNSSFTEYCLGKHCNIYGFPLEIGDEYAVIVSKKRDWSSIMYFKIPSENQIKLICTRLIKKTPSHKELILKIKKEFGYKGLMAYYHWSNPELLKKIKGKDRDELLKIMHNDTFEFFIRENI